MIEEKPDDINEFGADDSDEVQGMYEHFRFEVDKGQSLLRIDRYLTNIMAGVSRSRIQDAANAEQILVNGKSVKANYKVKPNDTISIVLAYPPSDFHIVPQDIPIQIVYEDEHIIWSINSRD